MTPKNSSLRKSNKVGGDDDDDGDAAVATGRSWQFFGWNEKASFLKDNIEIFLLCRLPSQDCAQRPVT